jgi:serine/threonine-protein kinase
MSEQILNGRYRLVAQQGSGGMAVIYRADDLALGRTVAIKILRPNLTSDPAFIARFRNEARSIANLMHPNIVTVHDVGNDGATHYIVMEFVEGLDLKKVIKSEGALTIERALRVAIQICAGIGFAHRAGIVHADVKPQNILITRDDTVKVTDFGIAQAFTDAQPGERQQVVWGSPHYFAPEQARGEKPTPASDVYSIGIVLFELLSGRLPYQGTDQQALALAHIRERIPMVNEFNTNVSDSLARIVFKTMSKEPSQRYRMADQLGSILSTYLEKGLDGGAQSAAVSPASQPGAGAVIPPPPQRMTTQQSPAPIPPAPPLPPAQGGWQPVAPLPPADPIPTQRFDLAPHAPPMRGNSPPVPGAYIPPAPGGTGFVSPPSGVNSNSGMYTPAEYDSRINDRAPGGTLDLVTIALAVLAFFAVACLIPLYIAVFQARFGS